MNLCTNTIKNLSTASVLVFILTYIISLNIENRFFIINSKWISSNFIYTITSGAFASILIVLICEYIKYLNLKQEAENAIFLKMSNLFGQILIIKYTCTRALHSHGIVDQYLIHTTCNNVSITSDNICGIDYTPLWGKTNRVKTILNLYISQKHSSIKKFPQKSILLQIAHNEEKIILLQQGKDSLITYDAPKVKAELIRIINQTLPILIDLDIILTQIDKQCNNRYHWQTTKESLYKYEDNYVESNSEQ